MSGVQPSSRKQTFVLNLDQKKIVGDKNLITEVKETSEDTKNISGLNSFRMADEDPVVSALLDERER